MGNGHISRQTRLKTLPPRKFVGGRLKCKWHFRKGINYFCKFRRNLTGNNCTMHCFRQTKMWPWPSFVFSFDHYSMSTTMLAVKRSAGVAPEMNPKNSLYKGNKHSSEVSTLSLKPEQMSPEVQNRGIRGPTKRTRILQNFFLKKPIRQTK